MSKVLLATRKYKAGYEVREELSPTDFEASVISYGSGDAADADELVTTINENRGKIVIVKSAYTQAGDYIGNKKMAHFLYTKKGIKPEKISPSKNKVCSIGFCGKEQKWYGWSHRAICGFGVGDIVKEGDCTASSGWTKEYLKEHPDEDGSLPIGFQAKDLNDARRMAVAFAESVG